MVLQKNLIVHFCSHWLLNFKKYSATVALAILTLDPFNIAKCLKNLALLIHWFPFVQEIEFQNHQSDKKFNQKKNYFSYKMNLSCFFFCVSSNEGAYMYLCVWAHVFVCVSFHILDKLKPPVEICKMQCKMK